VRINEVEEIGIARQLLLAHEYWRMKQFAVDLVILTIVPLLVQDLQSRSRLCGRAKRDAAAGRQTPGCLRGSADNVV